MELGVFGGAYFGLNVKEYPKSWFQNVKISKTFDVNLNRFKVISGLSREHWIEKGWIFKEDHWVGSNGIADSLMEEEFHKWMKFKSKDGKILEDTFLQLKKIVKRVILDVESDKDKLFYNGLTTPIGKQKLVS